MEKAALVYKANCKVIICCFFFISVFTAPVFAQVRGKVEVVKDARIDTFAARRIELNKTANPDGTINGFRLQIFTGSDRKAAYDAQAKFLEQFPDTRTYVIYSAPNFKVRVGDYRTRLDAEKMQDQLKALFDAMFIIPEKINPPKLDADE
jgi:hypothetical protein